MKKLIQFLHRHKMGLKLLSLILCVAMVFCYCGIQQAVTVEAVAGIDDIIVFVIALMIACGVSFTSAEIAENTAERFYDSADSEVKSIIEEAYAKYEADYAQDATIANGLIMCLASEWQLIFDSIAAFIFPQAVKHSSSFVDFSVANMSAYNSFYSLLQAEGTLSFEYQCSPDSYTSFSVGNLMFELIGKDIASSVPDAVMSVWNANNTSYWKDELVLMKITVLGTQYSFYQALYDSDSYYDSGIQYFNETYFFKLVDDVVQYTYGAEHHGSKGALISANNYISESYFGPYSFMYYGSELINAMPTYDGSTYSLSCDSIPNLISADGLLYGSDYLIPCDVDRITDDILTKVFTCDPTITIGNDYIGNDTTWQDSISNVGSGSIAFPLETDDLISLSPADVRDKTLTDTGDIVQDKTNTGDTSTTDKTKPKFPTAPELSLPEILFKEKFPFCLPWDLYNVFAGLVAEPEAPVFEIPMVWEFLDIDYTLVIDLSMFDEVARISRFFTSISFVVALILISRKMVGAE